MEPFLSFGSEALNLQQQLHLEESMFLPKVHQNAEFCM